MSILKQGKYIDRYPSIKPVSASIPTDGTQPAAVSTSTSTIDVTFFVNSAGYQVGLDDSDGKWKPYQATYLNPQCADTLTIIEFHQINAHAPILPYAITCQGEVLMPVLGGSFVPWLIWEKSTISVQGRTSVAALTSWLDGKWCGCGF